MRDSSTRTIVFTLGSGRSGTYFLSEVIRLNARDCWVVHEPLWQRGNPTFFGPAIHAAFRDDREWLCAEMLRKQRFIATLAEPCYIETSHAFLKSAYKIAHKFFPDIHLVRLIRDPLRVAKSQADREALIHRWHMPFFYYRAPDGQRYQRWALTGLEPIFRAVRLPTLTRFQWFLLEWLEIENRAADYVRNPVVAARCTTLVTPDDLNNVERIQNLLKVLGLARKQAEWLEPRNRNMNWGVKTVITPADRESARAVLNALPSDYLAVLLQSPYSNIPAIQDFLSLRKG